MKPDTFWAGKNVLLTGHTGFKGSWLAQWLVDLGANVTGFAIDPPTKPSLFEELQLADKITDARGDVRDAERLRSLFAQSKPEVVFHLAAQPLVRLSYSIPAETYAVNVVGTANVLDAVRMTESVRSVVVVTSDKCYENLEQTSAYRETDRLGGHDPYSNSKACAELVTAAYRSSFFAPQGNVGIGTARAGNVIGGGDWADARLVPDCVRSFASGQVVSLRRPEATRPWQHVLEPLAGYLRYAEALYTKRPGISAAYNFGPDTGDIRTVADVVALVAKSWGGGAKWVIERDDSLHEASLLHLDSTRAREELGWIPVWRLEEAVAKSVEWYRAWKHGQPLAALTSEQIKAYQLAFNE